MSLTHSTRTLATLGKHSRTEHTLGLSSNSLSCSLALPLHSTRNNSLVEVHLQENMTITNLSNVHSKAENRKKETLKYTCLECDYKTRAKRHMDRHVSCILKPGPKDVNFVCGTCGHEFFEKDDYNLHVKTHDNQEATPSNPKPDFT